MKKKLLLCLQSCSYLLKGNFARNTFLLIGIFVISLSGFAQGPGHPNVDAGEDIVLDCNETCTDLTAEYLYTGDTSTYSVSSIPYDPPFPFMGGTPVAVNIDDRWSPMITLPFEFCFYGQVYTQMVIGSNGVVSFDLTQNPPNTRCEWSFDQSIPNPILFHAAIFGPYMDIYPSTGDEGKINWTVFGEAPDRTMVVNFNDIKYFSCTNLKLTSQIVMYETTNVVEIYIKDRSAGCPNWNDGNAVVGIQNQDGTIGESAPGRNTGNWSATYEAWRYTPNGDSNVVFSWLDADGNEIGTDTTINVCPTDPVTVYTAQAIYTNCNGDVVTVTDDVQVTITGSIDVTMNLGPDKVFCDVASYEIIPEIVGDITGATFLWSPGGETTETLTVTDSGIYTLALTKDGCTIRDSVEITFLTGPCTVEPECEGIDFVEDFGSGVGRGQSPYTNYTFKATGQIDDGEYALVSTSAGLNTGWFTDMQDHTGDVDGRMMFVNASIAPDEFYRRTITLTPNTDFTFNAWITTVYDTNTGICPGGGIPANVLFRIEDMMGNTVAQVTTGDIENGTVPRWFEYSINFNTGNNTDVQLVLVNNSGGGCGNDLAIDDITLRHGTVQPDIVTPPDMSVCAPVGTPGVFDLESQIPTILNGQNPNLFNISFHTDELEAQSNVNPIADPSAYQNVSNPETIYVRVENVDQPSCFSIVSFDLTIEDSVALTTDLPGEVTICSTDPFPTLDATPTNSNIDLNLVTYEWKDPSGTVVSTDATYTPTVEGTYTVTLQYPPCSIETFTIDIIVNDPPLLDLGPDETICEGGSFEIIPIITGDTTGITYLWNTGETTPTIVVTESGVYSLEVTVGTCTATDSIEISITDPIIVDLGDDFDSCFDETTILTAQVADPQNMMFEWYLNGVLLSGENNQTLVITEIGEYKVIVTNIDGCTGEDTIIIGVGNDLEVTVDADFQTCPNEPHTLTATTSEENVTYQWFLNGDPIDGATNSTLDISLEAGLIGAQTYMVVINSGGCIGEDSVDITLYPIGNCVISQGISPNDDGYNDFLDLTFLNDRTGVKKLQIFNRYGTQVYEQVNYTNQWKGQTNDGKELPTGTYFYVIDLAGNDAVYGQQATGWIYLNQKAN
ncbi:gliding motility-associated C-terminal domain-containing protein [Aequorivita sp. H23M31]|uniref:Gliding motility-associated C-terminal domain-containing protein n=1 Tax=Aequorivita ciconiae TaxID=2494375 RepID=A0A410G5P9_9FLAO|nr:gliding motility-associated C-terminal domain-containing protein [Aequorivita sp. H23M31]QAA82583.1 gliding motility-associated C-terminal domain-containing protein [Aequorivita sp. H23M31]